MQALVGAQFATGTVLRTNCLTGACTFFFDGGRNIVGRMTSYFSGTAYIAKAVHVHLGPDIVTKRMDRVRGVAVHNVHETMAICASQWPKGLRSRSRLHYSGSTATNGLGPVVLPDVYFLWHALRPVKKYMYAKSGFGPVGGKRPVMMISRVKPKRPGHPPRHHPFAVPEQARQ